ncbi:MAG: Rieske 2Fe-2S domain-containing protein [Pseudomonadota bacterium]
MTSLAEGWERVCARDEVTDGEMLEVELSDGSFVLLLGVDGDVIAVCADCPHQDTPLSEGSLDGRILTCPTHFWQWDVTTGEPHALAEMPLPRFEVAEHDGTIVVRPRPD